MRVPGDSGEDRAASLGGVCRGRDGSREDELVLGVVGAAVHDLPEVLVGEEVGGSRQSPSERIAERSEMSGVALVEQLEGAVSEDWHAVAEPRLGVLVVELVHKRAIAFHGCRCCERVMPGGGGQRELANPRFLEVVRLS